MCGDLTLTNHNFAPAIKERLRKLVSPLRKDHPRVHAVVDATRFRLCVPNTELDRVRERLTEILSEDQAYEWHQRPLAASRRGIVRETEEDESERLKLYPLPGFFG